MSRSNMVCRAKSLRLFAGIAIYEAPTTPPPDCKSGASTGWRSGDGMNKKQM